MTALSQPKIKPVVKHPLTGLFFHNFTDDGQVKNQGHIIDVFSASDGRLLALCQLYEFVMGYPSSIVIFDTKDMVGSHKAGVFPYAFYKTQEDWNDAYQTNQKRYSSIRAK